MDDVRDIKNTDQFSRSLYAQVVRTSPFGRNASGEKAYRRAERIVAALHLLTNHITQDEPLRSIIRKRGVELLSGILDLRNEMRGASSMRTRGVQASIRELISLMRMLTVSGFVSFQNADTMIETLDELGSFLDASRRSTLSEDIVLSREDLVGDTVNVQKKSFSGVTLREQSPSDQKQKAISDIKDIEKPSLKMSGNQKALYRTENVSVRGQNILEVLRTKGETGIKDVSAHFPEYSEKMIQRELATLVNAKYVKKNGTKRWSKYSIAH